MISTKKIKELRSLHQKKFRRKENIFLLEGYRLINQALFANAEITEVWLTQKSSDSIFGKEIIKELENKQIQFSFAPDKIIKQISNSLNDQGIIALAPIPTYEQYSKLPNTAIYLDGISDPGNMGTILRTAAWFGIKSIFYSINCVDPFNSKVVRAAMGAHFYFSNFESNARREILNDFQNQGIDILGAQLDGKSLETLSKINFTKWILVLGNEAHGISNEIKPFISTNISIPGIPGMESLNVSIAAGILMHRLT